MGIPIWRSGSQDRRPESPKWHENSKASVGRNVSYFDLPKGPAWFLNAVNSPFVRVKFNWHPLEGDDRFCLGLCIDSIYIIAFSIFFQCLHVAASS